MDLDAIWPLVGLVTKSCLTLCDPLDCSPPGSSVPGILQSRIHFLLQGMFLIQGSNPCFLHCRQSAVLLQVDSLPTELAGKPKCDCCPYKKWDMKKKKKSGTWRQTYAWKEYHLNMKAGEGVMLLEVKNAKNGQQTPRSSRRGRKRSLLHSPWKEATLQTPCSWTSSLQNCETINFCCLSHWICGTLLAQPFQSNTI